MCQKKIRGIEMTKEEEKYTTLDTEQCKWWVNTLFNMAKEQACNSHNFDDGEEIQSAQDKIIKVLEIVEEFERAQIITGGRLNGRTYAYKCGLEDGKRKALEQPTSDDCVSRAELKKWLDMNFSFGGALRKLEIFDRIDKELPPVTPIHGTCKDCKYYRDKGNKYSYCTKRLNVDSAIDRYREPNFYCADFDKRGGENG